tara:strand:- start:20428 stop:20616 length:189 start_codon:yes stop_codon:yes gene_type:complete
VSKKKKKGNDFAADDYREMKARGKRKKHQRKSKRHFDKDALRGIMDGTVDIDAYQDYVNDEY